MSVVGVVMATHSKAGEDVGSGTDADSDHAVDPAEKPAVNPPSALNLCILASIEVGGVGGGGTHLS